MSPAPSERRAKRGATTLYLYVDRVTYGTAKNGAELVISIGVEDEEGNGTGHRICGPKYGYGSTEALIKHPLDARDVDAIYEYVAPRVPARAGERKKARRAANG